MRILTIGGLIGAGAVLLLAWMLAVAGTSAPAGAVARELNVVLFLGGTALLLIGIVVAVTTMRAGRRTGGR